MTDYYWNILFKIRAIAKMYGYAIAFHGSGKRDLDLVAIPWTDEACDSEALVTHLVEHLGAWKKQTEKEDYPILKPHGRKCYVLFVPNKPGYGCRGYVDLSVMPTAPTGATIKAKKEEGRG